jgi:killing trait domain-containing protein
MAGRKAADDETAADGGAPTFDLETAAIAPALAVSGHSAAVADAMALAAQNAVAQQQKTALLAMAATAKSVRLVVGAAPELDDLDLHSRKEP